MTEDHSKQSENPRASFEQVLASEVAKEFLVEQRRSRRWSILFKSLLALYLFSFLVIYIAGQWDISSATLSGEKHTALVDINGAIAVESEASADNIITGLRAAFENKNTAGVIIRINSPGGSPVQAGYVNDEIYRLREKYPDTPVYVVIRDICASGGYYIAAAAEKIYADKASLVGSIGVIMSGFGFVEAIDKLGVERRLRHAGKSKAFMDPFSELREKDVEHVDSMLDEIYQQFIQVVRKGRGDRLQENAADIFSGLIWTGDKAIALGLVDALGSSSYVAREVIGAEEIINFTYQEPLFNRFANRLGTAMGEQVLSRLNFKLNQ